MAIPGTQQPYPMRLVNNSDEWMGLVWSYQTSQPKPKKILAEGDSWLAYPQILGVKNIVWHLANNYKDMLLLSLASSGDEAVYMLTGSNKATLLETLSRYEFDYLLFSGGGNDIVGKWDFDFILKDYQQGMTAKDCIDLDRFARRIEQIKFTYMDLLEYVFTYSKSKNTIKVITHTYDWAIPSKKGVVEGSSWMWPYLMAKGIIDTGIQREIARYVLCAFADMVKNLAAEPIAQGRFTVVNTQDLVKEDEWKNEIHPNTEGFKKVADKIYKDAIK